MRRAPALGRQPAAHREEAPRRELPLASNACRQHMNSYYDVWGLGTSRTC